MSKYISTAIAAGAGLIAGLVSSLALQSMHKEQPQAQQQRIVVDRNSDGASAADWSAQNQLRVLERRLDSLQQEHQQLRETNHGSQAPKSETPEEAAQIQQESDPKLEHERAIERWNQELAEVRADPIDPTWAKSAERELEGDLLELGGSAGFKLTSAECRTSKCIGKTVWPTHGDAVSGFAKLLHHSYRLNCATKTILPEPTAGTENQSYEVTVIYDCSNLRAEG